MSHYKDKDEVEFTDFEETEDALDILYHHKHPDYELECREFEDSALDDEDYVAVRSSDVSYQDIVAGEGEWIVTEEDTLINIEDFR
ncbi:MAG: hypothetical protein BRC26_00405 [Nanohaloarchaea archaeon QH_8_44_6]|nr:MAG: hypothetical protein BRC26_00405 [Nanohaloarchaea archaeon QH_8_44_6]